MLKEILYSQEYKTKKDIRYKMKPSDNIWSVSRDFTGNPEAYRELTYCNAHIHDILRIYPGELITIPNRWVRLKKLVGLGIYDSPKQFGHDLLPLLLKEWINFYRFNAPETDRFVKQYGRLMQVGEIIELLNDNENKATSIALYWLLLNKFNDIFSFKLFSLNNGEKIIMGIEGVYYDVEKIDAGKFNLNVILIETKDITEINFNAMLSQYITYLNVEDILKIAAFHEQLEIAQIPDIATMLSIGPKERKK